jgi:tetratricopeptide (TPR) repeat protein
VFAAQLRDASAEKSVCTPRPLKENSLQMYCNLDDKIFLVRQYGSWDARQWRHVPTLVKDLGIESTQYNRIASMLAKTMYELYEQTESKEHIDIAVHFAQLSLHCTRRGDESEASRLNNLGVILGRRYERTGEMVDLEKAITRARNVVDLTPGNHPDRAMYLDNLGNKLGSRYKRIGDMADLKEAITAARNAVDSTPDDHLIRAGYLNNLGNKLESRYKRTGEMVDLEQTCRHFWMPGIAPEPFLSIVLRPPLVA